MGKLPASVYEFRSSTPFPFEKAEVIMLDNQSLTPIESLYNVEEAIQNGNPDALLTAFLCITGLKIESIPCAFPQDFEALLYHLQGQFGTMDGMNVLDNGLSIPLTLIRLSFLYFLGKKLTNLCDIRYSMLYSYLAIKTANFIEENF